MNFSKTVKQALLTGAISCCSLLTFAQGVYVKLGGGYNFGIGGDIKYAATVFKELDPNNGISTQSIKHERVNENYGKGVVFGGTLGYMFSRYIGAEVGINYLSSSKNEITDRFKFTNGQTANPNHDYNSYSRMLLLQPALVIALDKERWNPYTRFGVIAAKGKVFQEALTWNQNGGTSHTMEYSGGIALGLHSGIGLDFISLNENLLLFGEITFTNLHYSPNKGKLTRYDINTQDQLTNLPTSQKEIEFSDSFEENSINTPSDSSPRQAGKFNLPFGSVGINIGLKFNL